MAGPTRNTSNSNPNVIRSNSELKRPNSIMKRRRKGISQRRGRAVSSGSTLSPASPMAGRSERKLLSRI
jgi:hypothetical protein